MISHVNSLKPATSSSSTNSKSIVKTLAHTASSATATVKQSRFYSIYSFTKVPNKKNMIYDNTFYFGSQIKNGIKGRMPPIRKFSQTYQTSWNGSSSLNGMSYSKRHQLIKYIAIFSITYIFCGATIKYYQQYKTDCDDAEEGEVHQKRKAHPSHSWTFFCYSTLPLNAISRLWGQVNSIDLPVWMRAPSFRLYSYLFGANLDEIKEKDLTKYKNLSEFFYRELDPDARKIDMESDLVCPSDGTVLKFGIIENGNIEQVKGMTYSINSFLGDATDESKLAAPTEIIHFEHGDESEDEHNSHVKRHEEFANLNGISYTLDDILGGEGKNVHHLKKIIYKEEGEKTLIEPSTKKILKVAGELGTTDENAKKNDKELFYTVIYLAPGDYHRYHSPANWVVTLRRHFIGELYSVAPFFQRTLSNLFVLNERVSLLGYWKYGFFSMTPVGATNVGSIKVNFDKDLTTNIRFKDKLKVKKNTCYEAKYDKASKVLGGYPVTKGEEVGGFMLGSTVVLVFEAPSDFKFNIKENQKVFMGSKLGSVASAPA